MRDLQILVMTLFRTWNLISMPSDILLVYVDLLSLHIKSGVYLYEISYVTDILWYTEDHGNIFLSPYCTVKFFCYNFSSSFWVCKFSWPSLCSCIFLIFLYLYFSCLIAMANEHYNTETLHNLMLANCH